MSWLLFVPATVVTGISAAVYLQITRLSNASVERPSQEQIARFAQKKLVKDHGWALAHGFESLGIFREVQTGGLIAAWKHSEDPVFFCRYLVAHSQAYDFVTEFENNIHLTTGTPAKPLFPLASGDYKQLFSRRSLPELSQLHLQAQDFLTRNGAELRRELPDFAICFTQSVRDTANFVRSVPFWPLRATYWFLVRRHIRHNRTVKEQFERGWIVLPMQVKHEVDRMKLPR